MKTKTLQLLMLAALSLNAQTHKSVEIPNIPDAPTIYPEGKLGEIVKLGEDIVNNTNTHPLSKEYVGNKLTCASCHLEAGRSKTAGTFIGTATIFPAWSGREGSVQTLQDRIDNCFMRSMNGKRPPIDSELSIALASYITWLSTGLPIKMNSKNTVTPYYSHIWPDKNIAEAAKKATNATYKKGASLYSAQCAACHGEGGEGMATFPPLWGKESYNAGAGLAKPIGLATWIAYNMPLGNAILSDEDALSLAIYIDAQERPSFDLKDHLPSKSSGVYNSKITQEKDSVRGNFKAINLDIDEIRGDKVIK